MLLTALKPMLKIPCGGIPTPVMRFVIAKFCFCATVRGMCIFEKNSIKTDKFDNYFAVD